MQQRENKKQLIDLKTTQSSEYLVNKRQQLPKMNSGEDNASQSPPSLLSSFTTIPSSSVPSIPHPTGGERVNRVKTNVSSFLDSLEPLNTFRAKLQRENEHYSIRGVLGSARGTGLERCKKRRRIRQ